MADVLRGDNCKASHIREDVSLPFLWICPHLSFSDATAKESTLCILCDYHRASVSSTGARSFPSLFLGMPVAPQRISVDGREYVGITLRFREMLGTTLGPHMPCRSYMHLPL